MTTWLQTPRMKNGFAKPKPKPGLLKSAVASPLASQLPPSVCVSWIVLLPLLIIPPLGFVVQINHAIDMRLGLTSRHSKDGQQLAAPDRVTYASPAAELDIGGEIVQPPNNQTALPTTKMAVPTPSRAGSRDQIIPSSGNMFTEGIVHNM